jgi:carbon monoxide dehydrogenase subunit G
VVSGTRNGLQHYRCECLVHASSAALWDVVSDLRLILETSPGLRSYVLAGDPPRSATGELLFGWGPVERLLPITFALTVVTEQERLEVHVGAGNDAVRLHGVFDLEHLSRRTCNLTYQVSVEVTASAGMTAQLMKRSAQDVAEEHANRVVDRVVTLAEAAQLADDVLGGDRQE